jgi:ornithine cyclodeaminase/alanine dehydrogenase-like protein (mu-crystallin family)
VSGVATKHLANPDARSLGVIGTGRQARTQVAAVTRVRRIDEIRVFGRDPDRCAHFCADLVGDGHPATAVDTAEAAVRDADIVVTATTATEPVLRGTWLAPGSHVNAIGANYEHRRELDTAVVARASVVVTDNQEQARYEATDLTRPVAEGVLDWERVRGLDEIVCGTAPGRESRHQITLFESLGTALGDVALVARAYERAVANGAGERLPDLAG